MINMIGNSEPSSLRSILLTMLKNKNFEEFETTLNNNEDFPLEHFYKKEKGTLLDIACRSPGNSRIVNVILQHGIDINLKNQITGKAAIHEATQNSDLETLEMLLQNGNCDIDMVDSNSYTALDYATERDKMALTFMCLLSNYGVALPKIKSESSDVLKWGNEIRILSAKHTPIERAARYGNYETFRILLERNDHLLLAKDQLIPAGRTVLHMVIQGILAKTVRNDEKLHGVYRRLGQDVFTSDMDVYVPPFNFSLFPNETQDHHRLLHFILQHEKLSWCIEAFDENHNTALHFAVAGDDEISISALLCAGADMFAKNRKDMTALSLINNSKILKKFFDSCITGTDYTIKFDYRAFLRPPKERETESSPLIALKDKPHCRYLLRHPLITSYLNLKWYLVRRFFYLNFIGYFIHWALFISYAVLSPNISFSGLDNAHAPKMDHSLRIGDTSRPTCTHYNPELPETQWLFLLLISSNLVLSCIAVWNLIITMYNSFERRKLREWLKEFVNTGLLLIIFYTIIYWENIHPYLLAIAILLLSIQLFLLMGSHPSMVIHVEMMKMMWRTAIELLVQFSSLISLSVLILELSLQVLKATSYRNVCYLLLTPFIWGMIITFLIKWKIGMKEIEDNTKMIEILSQVKYVFSIEELLKNNSKITNIFSHHSISRLYETTTLGYYLNDSKSVEISRFGGEAKPQWCKIDREISSKML